MKTELNDEEKLLLKIKKFNEEWNGIIDKRDYYKRKIKNYENLRNRSICPCCDQKIDINYYESKLPELNEKFEECKKRLDELYNEKKENDKKLGDLWDKKKKEERKEIDTFIELNKKIMNKLIREYHNGFEIKLPEIPENKKELWNKSIEKYYNDKFDDDMEDDDLLYDN